MPLGSGAHPLVGNKLRPRVGIPSLGLEDALLQACVAMLVMALRRSRRQAVLREGFRHEDLISLDVLRQAKFLRRHSGWPAFHFLYEQILTHPQKPRRGYEGRIDFMIKSPQQTDDDDYFGIECKRLGRRPANLVQHYIRKGVDRFWRGTYSFGHPRAMMIGYVMDPPMDRYVQRVENLLRHRYPGSLRFRPFGRPFRDMTIVEGTLRRGDGSRIVLTHLFATMH